MLTPIGLSAEECLHSVRSAVTRLSLQPYPDRAMQWIVGGRILTRTRGLKAQRLEELASRALCDAWRNAHLDGAPPDGPVALLLGTVEPHRPGYRFPPDDFEVNHWLRRNGLPSAVHIEVFPSGNASCQSALSRATSLLGNGIGCCLIGAVDSQWQLRILRWHEEHERLKCSYVNDGLMPGEAACFVVVESTSEAQRRGAEILALVRSTCSATEAANVLSALPNTAAALTTATRDALTDSGVEAKHLGMVWCDLSGESYRGREWAFADLRIGGEDHTLLTHPADCHGDLGAVSDANLLALAAMSHATGWSGGKPALLFSGSEGGLRAASVVFPSPDSGRKSSMLQVSVGHPRALAAPLDIPPLGPDDVDYAAIDDPPAAYFRWQLRQEHLDEMTALYYQRQGMWVDPEAAWTRVAEPEQRILNHLDAVAASGDEAVWAVASGLLSEEEGACFAGALMLAATANPANLDRLDEAMKVPVATRLAGIEAGLIHLRLPALEPKIAGWLSHPSPDVQAMAAALSGRFGMGDPWRVDRLLASGHPPLCCAAADALRRWRHSPSIPSLQRLLGRDETEVELAALRTLLCLGDKTAAARCRELLRDGRSPAGSVAPLLAMCGDLADAQLLLGGVIGDVSLTESIGALGILGSVEGAPLLLDALRADDEPTRLAASEALELMFASGLRETAELVDEEDEDLPRGGTEIERTASSPDAWDPWWREHGKRFTTGVRWRRGRPFELPACVTEMRDPTSRLEARRRAYFELVIHTGYGGAFETDWFVAHQQTAIDRWQQWLNDNPHVSA